MMTVPGDTLAAVGNVRKGDRKSHIELSSHPGEKQVTKRDLIKMTATHLPPKSMS
jgi:hypothetical protein